MNSSPPFNPQAVLFYSPAKYDAICEVAPRLELQVSASLQSNGNYYVYSNGQSQARDAADKLLRSNGIRELRYLRQDSHQVALNTLAALRARITPDDKEPLAYSEFLRTKLACMTSATPPLEFVRARDEFLHAGRMLLEELQPFFPEYSIRELVNPVTCLALSKQRKGIFLWPDWHSQRYVNLIVSQEWRNNLDLREAIHAWADKIGVRINFGVEF